MTHETVGTTFTPQGVTLQGAKPLRRWAFLALLIILLGGVQIAQAQAPGGTLAVRGEGTAAAEPDQAHFDAGVSVSHEVLQQALDEANEAMTRVLDTLREEGIGERDIRTTRFQIQQEERQGEPRRFRVTNMVRVKVDELDRLGTLVNRVVEAGANELGNIRFAHADPAALERQAREAAVQHARDKAEQLAEFAAVTLGPVISISEPQVAVPSGAQPMMMRAEAMDSVPLAAGELSVQVSIEIVFALAE